MTIPITLAPLLLLIYGYIIPALVLLLVYYILNFTALLGAYLNERTDIQAKITWTFIEFLAPGFGAYVYFVFARTPKKIKEHLAKSELLQNEILNSDIDDTDIEMLINGEQKFPKLFEELSKAKHYINIQYFIMNPGILHTKLFSVLRERLNAGVKIKIIYDHLGNTNWSEKKINALREEGFELVEFRRINWLKPSGADNWRSHNKIVVIDGETSFIGGINFGDEYGGLSKKYGDWIDVHFICKGEIVETLNAIFCIQWFIATKEYIHEEFVEYNKISNKRYVEMFIPGLDPILIPQSENNSGPKYKKILYDSPDRPVPLTFETIKEEIRNATQSIKIITPYVAFPVSFKEVIRDAINRDVSIELITIGRADKLSAYYQGTFDADTLVELGAKVYRIENLFIHTKMFIFDDKRAIVGTSNLDYRALFHHFETNILTQSEKIVQVTSYFEKIKETSIMQTSKRSEWWVGRKLMYMLIRFLKGLF